MQHLTVDASFFWIMLFVAFAVGLVCQRFIDREDRRATRKQLADAVRLVGDVAAVARLAHRPLPMALHRRICDFRARVGA